MKHQPIKAPTQLPLCGCGGAARLEHVYNDSTSCRVVCTECGMSTPYSPTIDEPIRTWNRCFAKKEGAKC